MAADSESRLLAVTAIDGRYADAVTELEPIFSEFGLIKNRVAVEAGWLAVLGSGILPDREPLGDFAQDRLRNLVTEFSLDDAVEIKEIETDTRHDVKAVELWMRDALGVSSTFSDYLQLIHFGATSEDINNLAYGMQLRDARDGVLLPSIDGIVSDLDTKSDAYASIPMLSRTHGQAATPTTLGKEMAVYSERLREHKLRLGSLAVSGKFNGASGNYNALKVAYPGVNWPAVSQQFVESLGFAFNHYTTQIEPHDFLAATLNETALGNTILTDLSTDMWFYIMLGYFKQHITADEVGSSTMPHKVNPIDFENAEANFGSANATFAHLAGKLPRSRLQRDLSDSSAQRTIGEGIGHTLIAHRSLKRGLGKIYPNQDKIASDLDQEWAVLTEAVQTLMRKHNVAGAYEAIKAASRGRSLTRQDYLDLVDTVGIPDFEKDRLRALTPATYLGLAVELALGEY
jgi:adenylosuccinate lyase